MRDGLFYAFDLVLHREMIITRYTELSYSTPSLCYSQF